MECKKQVAVLKAQLAQSQLGAGQALQGMQGTNIARAGQVGAMDQAYAQAVDDAKREANRMALYEPMEDAGVLWNDSDIGIDWPIGDPILSPKDAAAPRLLELPELDA